MNDAVLIETYAHFVGENAPLRGNRFAFITHNIKDFSLAGGNQKLPHVDLAQYFLKLNRYIFRH